MDKVEKLSVGVAKMEMEHHARCEVIKHLREEREDHLAAALRIRTLLAPLLGVDVSSEPADEMVGRLVALYAARDERVAEKRGHDKGLLWAAALAFDFDPFSEDWTDEQRGAGERVLGLFAERLRDEGTRAVGTVKEVASPLPGVKLVVDPRLPEGVGGFTSPAMPRGMAPVQPTAGFYRVYDSNQTDAEEALYVKVTKDGVVWGYSEFEGVLGYRTLGKQWTAFAAEPGNERLRWMPDRDRVVVEESIDKESLRAWNPPLVPMPSLDGGLTDEEVAAVRALLKREGK